MGDVRKRQTIEYQRGYADAKRIYERKGKWSKVSATRYTQSADYFYRCSECGGYQVGAMNYCPHCGAKMEGSEE